ncbi:(2Fe-2S)-binding protein [Cumulibacter manganitolerans]|uniref:(2Fe-2S)-binding protein n=1 Tax=Cumulibacter manganitolerans TaxID=1884992 RepID=UPI001294C481|nr:(2Fe-2S)-binding protein [Cumulibacter manganitolerans]
MTDVSALLRSAGFAGDGVDLRIVDRRTALTGTTLADLADDAAALRDAVDEYAELQQQQFGPSAERHVAALWLLQDVAWIHAVLAVGLIGTHGISLRVPADGLGMELPRDMFFGVAVAADAIRTEVATSRIERAALYRTGRRHLGDLLEPLREPIRGQLRAGARAFWACVTDMATGAICTGASRRPDRLEEELAAFDAPTGDGEDRLLHGERLVPSPAGPIRRRHGCCLLYTIEGMSLCFSCPRIPAT